ncbi:MAG TPA: hypothetical protein VGS58_04155 [Candidatus Sulfopaludibacter sp.]|nr:hypothetical protein [Candidatus Sulfopaludibacter sp.]
MTPVPLDLPLRPPEAAEVASLVFELAERKPLGDEIRSRVAARAAALKLESIAPWFGSLARDPLHHSTYYLAVDVAHGPPQLLHMAPAAAPTSSVLRKPLLIGRLRSATGREMVVNAVPFSPADTANLDRFLSIDGAFLPRPHGSRAALVADASAEAFEAFRAVWKRTRKNVASVTGPFHTAVWSAIRAGWREGYSAMLELDAANEASFAAARDAIRDCPRYSRFLICAAPPDVIRLSSAIRQARSAAGISPSFDLGISLAASPTAPDALAACLQALRDAGHPAQFAAVRPEPARISALASVARQFNCVLGIRAADLAEEDPRRFARETAGRF